MAARTRSRLSSGSPIPMNTMFVRRRSFAGEPPGRGADLVDDLGDGEVAPEAELARRAERAADRAAGLARDAQRVALARSAARRVVHQDRFDERAVRQPVEGLLGQAGVRGRQVGVDDGVEAELFFERGAEGGRKRRDVIEAGRAAASTRRPRPGALETPARHDSANQAASSVGVRPEMPGRVVASSRADAIPRLALGRQRVPATGPRDPAGMQRQSCAAHRPAGPRRAPDGRRPWRGRARPRRRRRTCPGRSPGSLARRGRAHTTIRPVGASTNEPGHGW